MTRRLRYLACLFVTGQMAPVHVIRISDWTIPPLQNMSSTQVALVIPENQDWISLTAKTSSGGRSWCAEEHLNWP